MKLSIFSGCLALAVAVGSHATANSNAITVATGEYEPLLSSSAPDNGLVNRLVAEVFKEAGYDAEFKYMPWKRTQELTRRGRYPVSSFWYYSSEREEDFFHAGPLFEDRLVFFKLKSTKAPSWRELQDLEGLKIGVVDSYTYTEDLWALGESGDLTLEHGPSDEANLKKLLAGRIDVYPVSELTGRHILATKFTAEDRAQIEVLERPLSVTFAYLLVSRAHEQGEKIAADFTAALEKLRAADAAPEIMERLGAN